MTIINTVINTVDYASSPYIIYDRVAFNVDVKIIKIGFYSSPSGDGFSLNVRPCIYDNVGNLIFRNAVSSLATLSSSIPTYITLDTPKILNANQLYGLGGYSSNYIGYAGSTFSSRTVDGITMSFPETSRWGGSSGADDARAVSPNQVFAGSAYTFPFAYEIIPNSLPTAPTNLFVNSPVMTGNAVTANWTHEDIDADPQAKYQLRWRLKDT
jgi:hypothetical protein